MWCATGFLQSLSVQPAPDPNKVRYVYTCFHPHSHNATVSTEDYVTHTNTFTTKAWDFVHTRKVYWYEVATQPMSCKWGNDKYDALAGFKWKEYDIKYKCAREGWLNSPKDCRILPLSFYCKKINHGWTVECKEMQSEWSRYNWNMDVLKDIAMDCREGKKQDGKPIEDGARRFISESTIEARYVDRYKFRYNYKCCRIIPNA